MIMRFRPVLMYSALWLPIVSPIDFLVYFLSLSELLKVVLWSKALGMSSVFYLVAVLGDLAVMLTGCLNGNLGYAWRSTKEKTA